MAAAYLHSSFSQSLTSRNSIMAPTLSLNTRTVQQPRAALSRLHMGFHFLFVSALLYYRISNLTREDVPFLSWSLITVAEMIFAFIWTLTQAFRWSPVVRTVASENLPAEEELPGVDVFICTADPKKEPAVEVMNTVLSAMGLDYPVEKLAVYLSDDGGTAVTLYAMKEGFLFARSWVPFCRKYGIKSRCPEAYFSSYGDDEREVNSSDEFKADNERVQSKYEIFKRNVEKAAEIEDSVTDDRPPYVEVIYDNKQNEEILDDQSKMPLLVYLSREKRPSKPHRFKAGALNALLRVSGIMSNAPYVLVLDCDMYCNDPTSAKQAMCFHLDPELSPSLSYAQFPQIFFNVSKNDIYDGQARAAYKSKYQGMDGLSGTVCSGTGYYLKKKALYCSPIHEDEFLYEPEKTFGFSTKLIDSVKALNTKKVNDREILSESTLHEAKMLASCPYEQNTRWGKDVTNPWFSVFATVFLSSLAQHLYEVFSSGGSIRTMWNEQRIWMMKCVTACLFGCLDVLIKYIGLATANFRLTNKSIDKEKLEKYERGEFDFQGAKMFMIPLTMLVLLNLGCFLGGIKGLISEGNVGEMLGQGLLSLYILVLSLPILEGFIPKI